MTLAQHLTNLIHSAATSSGHFNNKIRLETCVPCNNPDHGDYQSNYAFRVAKAARVNPREVANAMVASLADDVSIEEVSVAGPGFINFRLKDDYLAADLAARVAAPSFGADNIGHNQTVVIDYSSPNVAKRMHVGHLRSTVIGDALRRIHQFCDYKVVADNHIGDWGTQFGMLMVAWREELNEAAFEADPVGELQRLYQWFSNLIKELPERREEAKAEVAKLQRGDEENLALWRRFVEVSMVEFNAMYARLGIEFDVVYGESFYNDRLPHLVAELKEKGIAVDSEGAVIVPFEAEDGKGLKKNPLVIQKSDGAFLYGTTDLATLEHRKKHFDPSKVLYVVDSRQSLHFRKVFAAGKKMGVGDMGLVHVSFGMLKFPGGVVASTREGTSMNLVDVLDAARDKAREIVDAKSQNLPESEKHEISEAIGVSTIRFFDLSQNPATDIIFDWDRAMSLDGGSAAYLMYAHARMCSLLRRAQRFEQSCGHFTLGHPLERKLALLASRLPEVVQIAAASHRPNLLAEHLDELARAFSSFYAACPVLKEGVDAEVRRSRVELVCAVRKALATGMQLLGVKPIERM